MTTKTLTVIGGGKMGEALVGGLLSAEWAPAAEIVIVEPVAARRDDLEKAHDGLHVAASIADLGQKGIAIGDVLLAVKPDQCEEVCRSLEGSAIGRVLSIAAGVTTAALESWLPPAAHVVRAMPNTPALVGCGMAAISGGSAATVDDLGWASGILASVGEVVTLDEAALDAVTGVSGSGPAYVFLLAEALIDAGVGVGLDRATADVLTRQTLLGAARLLVESGEEPAQLRQNVTSPGGTTAAGLAVFEQAELRDLVEAVVRAATERSRELGEQ